jgi:hypothetical protein
MPLFDAALSNHPAGARLSIDDHRRGPEHDGAPNHGASGLRGSCPERARAAALSRPAEARSREER